MQILIVLENKKIKDLEGRRAVFSIINRFFTPRRYHANNDKKICPGYGDMKKDTDKHSQRSLHDIMNMMAQRVDGYAPERPAARGTLTEAEAYAHGDPLLAELLKDYRDSHHRYESLLRKHGADDAMVDVAADMAGSADTAVETRLIELRACTHARTQAEQRMQDSLEIMSASTRYHEKIRAYTDRVQSAALRAKKEAAESSYLFVIMMLFMLQESLRETQRRLSLASDFAVVSSHEHRRVAA